MKTDIILYRIIAEFLDDKGKAFSVNHLVFWSENDETSVQDAWRWCRNRMRTYPEAFNSLLAIKVGRFYPQPASRTGLIDLGNAFPHYEWKCDTGGPPPTGEEYTPKWN